MAEETVRCNLNDGNAGTSSGRYSLLVPSPLIAAIGIMKSPNPVFFFNPPHLPKNSTAFGVIADNKSITVAAIALPMPKLIMVMLLWVAVCMALSVPIILTPYFSAKMVT